jgi:hypothetical protein
MIEAWSAHAPEATTVPLRLLAQLSLFAISTLSAAKQKFVIRQLNDILAS